MKKNLRYIAAVVALLPVFASMPACSVETTDEETEESMEAMDTPDLESVAVVGCNKSEYVGAGSCKQSCTKIGTCVSGAFKWSCSTYNYEHWKGLAGENNYFKTSGPGTLQFCQNTNPANCPGFCN